MSLSASFVSLTHIQTHISAKIIVIKVFIIFFYQDPSPKVDKKEETWNTQMKTHTCTHTYTHTHARIHVVTPFTL